MLTTSAPCIEKSVEKIQRALRESGAEFKDVVRTRTFNPNGLLIFIQCCGYVIEIAGMKSACKGIAWHGLDFD